MASYAPDLFEPRGKICHMCKHSDNPLVPSLTLGQDELCFRCVHVTQIQKLDEVERLGTELNSCVIQVNTDPFEEVQHRRQARGAIELMMSVHVPKRYEDEVRKFEPTFGDVQVMEALAPDICLRLRKGSLRQFHSILHPEKNKVDGEMEFKGTLFEVFDSKQTNMNEYNDQNRRAKKLVEEMTRRHSKKVFLLDGHGRMLLSIIHAMIERKLDPDSYEFVVVDIDKECQCFHEHLFPQSVTCRCMNILDIELEETDMLYMNFCSIPSRAEDILFNKEEVLKWVWERMKTMKCGIMISAMIRDLRTTAQKDGGTLTAVGPRKGENTKEYHLLPAGFQNYLENKKLFAAEVVSRRQHFVTWLILPRSGFLKQCFDSEGIVWDRHTELCPGALVKWTKNPGKIYRIKKRTPEQVDLVEHDPYVESDEGRTEVHDYIATPRKIHQIVYLADDSEVETLTQKFGQMRPLVEDRPPDRETLELEKARQKARGAIELMMGLHVPKQNEEEVGKFEPTFGDVQVMEELASDVCLRLRKGSLRQFHSILHPKNNKVGGKIEFKGTLFEVFDSKQANMNEYNDQNKRARKLVEEMTRCKSKKVFLLDGHGRMLLSIIHAMIEQGLDPDSYDFVVVDNDEECHCFHEHLFPESVTCECKDILEIVLGQTDMLYMNFCSIPSRVENILFNKEEVLKWVWECMKTVECGIMISAEIRDTQTKVDQRDRIFTAIGPCKGIDINDYHLRAAGFETCLLDKKLFSGEEVSARGNFKTWLIRPENCVVRNDPDILRNAFGYNEINWDYRLELVPGVCVRWVENPDQKYRITERTPLMVYLVEDPGNGLSIECRDIRHVNVWKD